MKPILFFLVSRAPLVMYHMRAGMGKSSRQDDSASKDMDLEAAFESCDADDRMAGSGGKMSKLSRPSNETTDAAVQLSIEGSSKHKSASIFNTRRHTSTFPLVSPPQPATSANWNSQQMLHSTPPVEVGEAISPVVTPPSLYEMSSEELQRQNLITNIKSNMAAKIFFDKASKMIDQKLKQAK